MEKTPCAGVVQVVRRAYTVASFAALSWLVQGGCTACYVISVPLVLCSSLFGTLVFLGMFYSIVFHSIVVWACNSKTIGLYAGL